MLSSTLGILIGDTLWLVALTEIGAARVLIVDAMKPFVAVVLGWFILGERLDGVAFSGVILTVVGILIVSLEKEGDNVGKDDIAIAIGDTVNTARNSAVMNDVEVVDTISEEEEGMSTKNSMNDVQEQSIKTKYIPSGNKWGYLCALTNVIFDAYGSLLTKQHGINMTTWTINLIRFGFAGIVMAALSSIMRIYACLTQEEIQQQTTKWYKLPSMKYKAWIKVSIGVGLVTFLCPALSNYALLQIALVLAITLGSVTPLYALVLEWPLKGRRPTLKSVFGSFLAVGGVVILSIWN